MDQGITTCRWKLSSRKGGRSIRGEGERTAVVLDRHPLWREAIADLLERVGVRVVGRTSSASDALGLLREKLPGLLVLGLDMEPDGDGLALLRRAREIQPRLRSVVVSAREDAGSIEAAFAVGATVYCVKTAEPDDLALAIKQAFEHSIFFAAGGTRSVRPVAEEPPRERPLLTKREREILQLVAEGYSNSQLAGMLWVTEQTVKFHLSNIYRKLDVSNRTEASRWAQLHGLLSSSPQQRASAQAR